MNNYMKYGLLSAAIVGALGWLAVGGVQESATYYKEIKELRAMGSTATEKRIRVGGDVTTDEIRKEGKNVFFILAQKDLKLEVVYSGIDPLPDTFKPGAQALADGKLGADGKFYATKIQAKCASKYESAPTVAPTRS
jgi:cytochrome c-type biogenesis protein CcmE